MALVAALMIGCGEGGESETAATTARHSEPTVEAEETTETSSERPRKLGKKAKPHPKPARHLRSLNVTLDGYEGPENMGIVVAVQRGYFEDVGLDVGIVFAPASPLLPVKYVVEGVSDIAITHQPQVVVAQDKKAPVIAVGALVRKPTAAMIWLEKSQIDGIADLKGKTIAIPGLPFQREFLKSALAQAGLTLGDVKVEFVGYDLVSSLVSGDVDAIFGGSWNVEGVELETRGLKPVITRAQDLGIPRYDELVLIVRSDHLAEKSKWIRAFTSAVARGTAAAIKDPKGAVRAIEEATEHGPEATRKSTKAGVEATLPLLSKSGYMSPDQANKLVDWMFEEGMIKRKPPVSALLNNAYLEP